MSFSGAEYAIHKFSIHINIHSIYIYIYIYLRFFFFLPFFWGTREIPKSDPAKRSGEVSEWIRSIGGGGKLSQRLIEEIEDSYDHLRQISDNYRPGFERDSLAKCFQAQFCIFCDFHHMC